MLKIKIFGQKVVFITSALIRLQAKLFVDKRRRHHMDKPNRRQSHHFGCAKQENRHCAV